MLRVLAYLACTSEFSLTGKFGGRHDDLEAYSDSDMAGNQARDTRSQTGIMLIQYLMAPLCIGVVRSNL